MLNIRNSNSDTIVTGTNDRDSIYNSGQRSTIDVGDGNDTIYNYGGDNSSIDCGSGNDSVFNYYGSRNTIHGGKGNDTINFDHALLYNVIESTIFTIRHETLS